MVGLHFNIVLLNFLSHAEDGNDSWEFNHA